jgi:hypothetical protein
VLRDTSLVSSKPRLVHWDILISDDNHYAFVCAIEREGALWCKTVLVTEPQDRVYVQANDTFYVLAPSGETRKHSQAVITPDPGDDYIRVPIVSKSKLEHYIPKKHAVRLE